MSAELLIHVGGENLPTVEVRSSDLYAELCLLRRLRERQLLALEVVDALDNAIAELGARERRLVAAILGPQ